MEGGLESVFSIYLIDTHLATVIETISFISRWLRAIKVASPAETCHNLAIFSPT